MCMQWILLLHDHYFIRQWRFFPLRDHVCSPEMLTDSHIILNCAYVPKHVPSHPWHSVPFWKMCISKARFRLRPTLAYRRQTLSFQLIAFEVALHLLLKNRQTNKCSLDLLLVFLHNFLCFWTLHLTFYVPKFAQCQTETCFRMHIFHNGTECQSDTSFRMALYSERHATRILYVLISCQAIIATHFITLIAFQ